MTEREGEWGLTPLETAKERAHDAPLVGGDHEETEALAGGAGGAPVPVHVGVGGARGLVVHDVVDRGDVQPARCDVCREQHAARG